MVVAKLGIAVARIAVITTAARTDPARNVVRDVSSVGRCLQDGDLEHVPLDELASALKFVAVLGFTDYAEHQTDLPSVRRVAAISA